MAGRRLGPLVLAVLRHVAANPGCSRSDVVGAMGPDRAGSGYQAVQRCVRAGLLRTQLRPTAGRYNTRPQSARQVLFLTAAGEMALAEADGL